MLTPKTPLPWRIHPEVESDIVAEDDVCVFPLDCTIGPAVKQDMEYAVYAANLLPKLIIALEEISKGGPLAVSPSGVAKSALKLVETYRP